MIKRQSLLKFVIPIIAIGVLMLACGRSNAAEDATKVAAAATPRPKAPIKPAVKRAAPAPAAGTQPASATLVTPAAAAPSMVTEARKEIPEELSWGKVNGENVNVRTGPSTQNAIVTTFRAGEVVKARASQNGWIEIDWPQSAPAWIAKESVLVSAADSRVVGGNSRVYSAGTPQSTVLGTLEKGATVNVVGEAGNWYKIKAPACAKAYISAKYVITGVQQPANVAAAPAPAAPVKAAPVAAPKEVATANIKPAAPTKAAPAASSATDESARALQVQRIEDEIAKRASEALKTEEDRLRVKEESARAQKQKADEQARRDAESKRVAEEVRKKAESEETARRDAESKRLAEESRRKAEAEESTRKRAEAEETARRDTEAKRLAEETARQDAEAKRVALETRRKVEEEATLREAEAKRRALESRRKAEVEEAALREAECKRIALETRRKAEAEEAALRETESKRIALETRRKAEAEETARREADEKRVALEARRKIEAEESARREAESKRIALETRRRAEAEETARQAAEAKRMAEAQETARRDAETRKVAEETRRRAAAEEVARREKEEFALRAAEVRRKAEAEEQARVADSERARKLLEGVSERYAAELKKAEQEAQNKHASEAEHLVDEIARIASEVEKQPQAQAMSSARPSPSAKKAVPVIDEETPPPARLIAPAKEASDGLFRDPTSAPRPAPAPSFPEPGRRKVSDNDGLDSTDSAALAVSRPEPFELDGPAIVEKTEENAPYFEYVPETNKNTRTKYILPSRGPGRPAPRAEVITLSEGRTRMHSSSPSIKGMLPRPSGVAPASFRLDDFQSQICGTECSGTLVTADGLLERRQIAPMSGCKHALVSGGVTLHFLKPRGLLDLEMFIGRQVNVTGIPINAPTLGMSILEVGSISALD